MRQETIAPILLLTIPIGVRLGCNASGNVSNGRLRSPILVLLKRIRPIRTPIKPADKNPIT